MTEQKIVVVTGGASGIGKAIALEFAKQGNTVVIVDKDKQKGEETLQLLNSFSKKHLFILCDLSQKRDMERVFEVIQVTFGRCNILINNAGVSEFKSLFDISLEEFDYVLNVNLRAAFYMSKLFAQFNKGCVYGRIINIASTRYLMSEPQSEAYASSKGGIVSLTHALALSLKEENITVNCISPGWIQNTNYESLSELDHNQHPSKRVGKPIDIANMCLFLTDESNDFINGENIVIDGGMTKKMRI
jgi:NAD(P)-dependent dehydrogenase (short-subunit alcohol dehydrogenase family)